MKARFYALSILFFPFLFPSNSRAQLEKSLLWEISGNGLSAPSYLYGTMHVGDKRAHEFSKATLAAFQHAKTYAGELNMEKVDPVAMMNLMKLPSGTQLHTLFSASDWAKVEAYCRDKVRVNPNDFDDYNIFFLYSLIAQSQFKNQKGRAVDIYFYEEAKKGDMKLLGLETVEEQIATINSMSIEKQQKMLMEAIERTRGGTEKDMKMMMKCYGRGDLEGLLKMSEEMDLGTDFETAFITERNHRMADRMVLVMESGPAFVAVGALHLPGEEGMIALLKGKGYAVRAVR
ncbi:MAG: hypothetical protein RLZZ165_228 [Bacteroidota bacterium]